MTTDPPINPQDPGTRCPDWCAMHIDGRHVGELELAAEVNGSNIYVRPIDYGDDQVGLQIIVAKPDGTQVSQVEIEPRDVTEAAWLSELRRSLAVTDGNPADGEDSQ